MGKTIEQVLQERGEAWMAVPGVVGVAVGRRAGRVCLRVLVLSDSEDLRRAIPDEVDGFPVEIVGSGPITARD